MLSDAAELDDQLDHLGSDPEGQLHGLLYVVPAALRDDHKNPFYRSAERSPLDSAGRSDLGADRPFR